MKQTILFIMLAIAACNLQAQTETGHSGSVLWKISGKDLTKPSWLLGTLHMKSGEYLDSIPGALPAFQASEQVAGEINMSDMAALQLQVQKAMMMTPDTTYKMLYSDENYRFVSEKVASLMGAGLDQLGMLKPAAIQLSVASFAYIKFFPDFNPSNVLDVRIQAEAVKAQKPVLSLETADDQIHILFGIMNLQRQADVLLCSMQNLEKSMNMISELITNYNQGDLSKIYQQMKNSDYCPSTPEEEDAINKDRNIAWMKKLPEMMKDKSCFIAVGALHLAGEDGLLYILEQSGYIVEPIR